MTTNEKLIEICRKNGACRIQESLTIEANFWTKEQAEKTLREIFRTCRKAYYKINGCKYYDSEKRTHHKINDKIFRNVDFAGYTIDYFIYWNKEKMK